jgi:two-component system NtrC family sensor kinase
VSRVEMRAAMLIIGGVLMGGAIAGMHYIGMASMAVGASITYSAPIVALSIVIAIVASWVALGLAFSFRGDVSARGRQLKSVSAIVMGVAIAGMHYTAMAAVRFTARPVSATSTTHIVATGALAAAIVVGITVILALALVGAVIDRNIQSKVEFAKQLSAQTVELAQRFDESQRLTAKLEEMNGELQKSLAEAENARRELAEQHAANLELERIAQQEAVKARWLAGVAETTTALAHEVNNPLTALLMNAELLLEIEPDEAGEPIAAIRSAARRIAKVVERLTSVEAPRSVSYLGESRMLDLSRDEDR